MIVFWESPHFQWGPLVKLRSHFQFHIGCDGADGHVGPIVFVSPEPFGCVFGSLLSRFKDALIQPFAVQPAIVTLYVFFLLWFSYFATKYFDFIYHTLFLMKCNSCCSFEVCFSLLIQNKLKC